ncbi:piRNA-mediated silencing protein C19orf84 homolog [Pelodiscus sinensis]|uniref:piRNA-mediated silencing protein C19orf84 homolog n=1 Tax=Pelodiscus sinensis TaxID=13735 RepID=UPI003F6AAB3F
MEGPSGAARSAGSPSPTEPPASDQTALEKIPVVPSCPMPASGTPWILGRPSAGALSSITVPIRLDALSYLLNSALMGAYSALPQTPLYGGQGALALGHGAPPQQALGCRCQPHYCCAPLPACANPQQAQVGCYGSSAVGQSSAGYSQGISGVRGDWQDFSPRWERRGSPSPRSWGENGRARGQKDFSRPWGGQRPRGEEESAPRKAGLWNPGSRRAPGSDYAARKRNQDGRPWDAPGAKRWSSGCPQRWGSGPGETKAAKATGEDWEADYAGSTAQRSVSEKAKSSQAGLPASQEGEDWEKEYEEPPKSVPAVPPPAEVPSKVQAASGQEKKTPRPAAKDSTFSSYLQNLFSDVQRGSSAGSEPRRAGKPQGGAAEGGMQRPGEGGPRGRGLAELGDFAARRADPAPAAAESKDSA